MTNSRKEKVSDESIVKEIRVLKTQIKTLEKQLVSQSPTPVPKPSVQFLISEFNELGQFWRHTDARLESGINLYITASTLIVPGVIFLSQQVTDPKTFILFIALIAFALFIGGIILAERILRVAFVKAEYTYGLNLIRRYFVDKDISIKDYLIMPVAHSFRGNNDASSTEYRLHHLQQPLLVIIYIWNSLLLGLVVGSATWLMASQIEIITVVIVGIIVGISCFSILSAIFWLRKKAG